MKHGMGKTTFILEDHIKQFKTFKKIQSKSHILCDIIIINTAVSTRKLQILANRNTYTIQHT